MPGRAAPPADVTGALHSEHPHPRPFWRRITAAAIALGLGGIAFGVAGLLALAIGYGLPLLALAACFLAALALPLLLLSALHPRVGVYERGLWIEPLVWRGSWVPWEAVAGLADHTLIQREPRTRWEHARDGRLVLVEGALPPIYRVVGLMAGLGARPAFGIATHSHRDYPALLNAVQRHKRRP